MATGMHVCMSIYLNHATGKTLIYTNGNVL